jgi:hypothetical protein
MADAVVIDEVTTIQIATRLLGDPGILHPLADRQLYSVVYTATRYGEAKLLMTELVNVFHPDLGCLGTS